MSCSHLRQWVPTEPGESQLLPCADLECREGIGSACDMKVAEPPPSRMFVTSAATFFEDARALDSFRRRAAIYEREYVRGDGLPERSRWRGPADPWGSR